MVVGLATAAANPLANGLALTQTQLAVKAVHQARPDMTASEILDAVHLVQRQ